MPAETGVAKVSAAPVELVAVTVNVRVVPTGAVDGATVTELIVTESRVALVVAVDTAPSASVTVTEILIVEPTFFLLYCPI